MSRPAERETRLPTALPETAQIYLRPIGLTCGKAAEKLVAAGNARRLAGGPWFFAACEVVLRAPPMGLQRATAALEDIEAWADSLKTTWRDRLRNQLEGLTGPRFAPGGKRLMQPLVMGVIDLAGDFDPSSSKRLDHAAAADRGRRLAAAGADLIEVVGPSVRLGADAITARGEANGILPLIRGLNELVGVAISVDTRYREVAEKALASGATVISDRTALIGGPETRLATTILGTQDAPVGGTDTSSNDEEWAFELFDRLEARIDDGLNAGLSRTQLIADSGFGSADKGGGSVAILNELALFHCLGCPVVFSLSFGALDGDQHRAAALRALDQGAQILRTQDVSETRQILDLWERLIASGR